MKMLLDHSVKNPPTFTFALEYVIELKTNETGFQPIKTSFVFQMSKNAPCYYLNHPKYSTPLVRLLSSIMSYNKEMRLHP